MKLILSGLAAVVLLSFSLIPPLYAGGLSITVEEAPPVPTLGKILVIKVTGAEQTISIEILSEEGELIEKFTPFPASKGGQLIQPWIVPSDLEPGKYTFKVQDAFNIAETTWCINVFCGKTIESNGTGGGDWNSRSTWSGGIIPTANDIVIIKSTDTVNVTFSIYIKFFGSITIEQGGKLLITVTDDTPVDSKGGESNEHLTRPTFGPSHETFEEIVDGGFKFNNQIFPITNNHHTDFPEQTVTTGVANSFSATVYADKGLKVQEFLFGIPDVGQAHLAEIGLEVWYDINGEITQVKAVQKSDVIDIDTIIATHEKTKCQNIDIEYNCDTTNLSMVFLEPLQHKVMAIKAIDHKNRYQITYLNEGIDVTGDSLNSMNTMLIPSNTKGEGQLQITQIAKYSPYWIAQDGRIFEKNSFDSFKQINQKFERFEDSGNPYTRLHSEFGKLVAYEQNRATLVFDSSELISKIPESFTYVYPKSHQRITEEMKEEMIEQEIIAKKFLDETALQARW